jgi:hypothetical protein
VGIVSGCAKHGPDCRQTACEGWAYFSNGTEFHWWQEHWCFRPCLVDLPFQNDISQHGCPLLVQALIGERVDRWLVNDHATNRVEGWVTCLDFKPPGWRNPTPAPKPAPPGQDRLFDAPSGRRTLVQPQERRERVLA